MDALYVILGFMGPLIVIGIIGIFWLIHDNKRREKEQ